MGVRIPGRCRAAEGVYRQKGAAARYAQRGAAAGLAPPPDPADGPGAGADPEHLAAERADPQPQACALRATSGAAEWRGCTKRLALYGAGAASWPRYGGAFTPAREWLGSDAEKLFDLPLVALSLPGLVLDPRPDGDAPASDAALGLPIQYRYDLPYTDEIQALAQLPKIPKDPRESSPLPDTPRPEPPRPLTRIDYAAHWQRLAERANLASADNVAAFAKRDGQTVLRYLIAQQDWPVRAAITLDSYPGALTLDNADASQSAPLPLEREKALRGIDGRFANGTGDLRRLPDGAPAGAEQYQITAGSMAAHRTSAGGYRDQRGLIRAVSLPGTNLHPHHRAAPAGRRYAAHDSPHAAHTQPW